jgi:serine/threonine protein kinase
MIPKYYKDIEDLLDNIRELGSGNYGIVYSGNLKTGAKKTVVAKTISKKQQFNGVKEAEILAQLANKCQDNIVCFIDLYQTSYQNVIIMEFLGQYIPLSTYMQQVPLKTTPEHIMAIVRGLKNGMNDFHSVGIAHRDIKPDNIMIEMKTLKIKYIDFGLACHDKDCDNPQSMKIGTPKYMAPELFNTQTVPKNLDGWIKTDHWSLGVTILSMICGDEFYNYYRLQVTGGKLTNLKALISHFILAGGFTSAHWDQLMETLGIQDNTTVIWIQLRNLVLNLMNGNPMNRFLSLN